MKTNLKPQPLYGQTHIQHMTRLAVATLTVAILFGLMAGCDVTDPVIAPPPDGGGSTPPVDDDGDDDGRDDNAPACPSPSISLVGTWELIGFSKNGIELGATGTYLFGTNGKLTIQATIGGRDSSREFFYRQSDLSMLTLYHSDVAYSYSLSFCGNEATLTLAPPPPFGGSLIYTLRSIH